MSEWVKTFTEAQVQEMVTRGATLGLAATIRFALDADPLSGRCQWPAKTEYGLRVS